VHRAKDSGILSPLHTKATRKQGAQYI